MPEIRLRHPRFTYNACGPITKNKEKIRKKEKRNSWFKIIVKMNYINLVLNMIWAMGILKT